MPTSKALPAGQARKAGKKIEDRKHRNKLALLRTKQAIRPGSLTDAEKMLLRRDSQSSDSHQ